MLLEIIIPALIKSIPDLLSTEQILALDTNKKYPDTLTILKVAAGIEEETKRLEPEQITNMITEWDTKSIEVWADTLDVSIACVLLIAQVLNNMDSDYCDIKAEKGNNYD